MLTRRAMAAYNDDHRALFEALKARDADRAVAVIRRHLDAARRQLATV